MDIYEVFRDLLWSICVNMCIGIMLYIAFLVLRRQFIEQVLEKTAGPFIFGATKWLTIWSLATGCMTLFPKPEIISFFLKLMQIVCGFLLIAAFFEFAKLAKQQDDLLRQQNDLLRQKDKS